MLSRLHKKLLYLVIISFLATIFYATEVKAVIEIEKFQESSKNRGNMSKRAAKIAKVRIKLTMTPFERIVVKNTRGASKLDYRASLAMKHTLRARIERTNHFYVNNWHIESLPVRWSKEKREYTTKLRFFKRYGVGDELEEHVGNLVVSGVLQGENELYVLQGYNRAKFNDRLGNPVLNVEVGNRKEFESKALISKKTEIGIK